MENNRKEEDQLKSGFLQTNLSLEANAVNTDLQKYMSQTPKARIAASPKNPSNSGNQTTRATNRQFKFPQTNQTRQPSRCSVKQNGFVKAYAANTNKGIIRDYNEDRVAIVHNIVTKSAPAQAWPKWSFFGLYDGHGGSNWADFLRDKLHRYIVQDSNFPWNPTEAILKGFAKCEEEFLSTAEQAGDKSGSCAIIVLIVGDMCHVANVGDSRCIMSGNYGKRIYPLSTDHKPEDKSEFKRIRLAGGKVYRAKQSGTQGNVHGPWRVMPGRLAVSRSFGDYEAKLPAYNGNPKCIIAIPEIKSFPITEDLDFIVLACDGVYDKLKNKDVAKTIWSSGVRSQTQDWHQAAGHAVEALLQVAMQLKSVDNVTALMIALKGFKTKIKNPGRPS